ncbi:MAG: adenine phosphoribosyltransferase [Deltaproteobacteria bacterium]|nr:adenine phosphoribosyltransferase [Deltaproteobacteria bacterium]
MKLLEKTIRAIPDFPQKGIIFRDITPVLAEPSVFKHTVESLCEKAAATNCNSIVAIESRGFLFASAMAYKMNLPLIIVRKPGKLPWKVEKEEYSLEYGTDTLEIHKDSITKTDKIVIVDDLLATGGTAAAAARLVKKLGGSVVGYLFVVELDGLGGRVKLSEAPVESLITYKEEG